MGQTIGGILPTGAPEVGGPKGMTLSVSCGPSDNCRPRRNDQ
jgi:hypothetical protein